MEPMIVCPTCSGTGWITHEDRHTQTNKDVCRTCMGECTVPAGTGGRPTAAFNPATGKPFEPGDLPAQAN